MHQRLLLSQLPRFLADLLDGVPGIDIAGEVGVGESLASRIEETRADVLIVAQQAIADSATAFELLNLYPRLRVLVLMSDEAHLYELQPARSVFSGLTFKELVSVISKGRATGAPG